MSAEAPTQGELYQETADTYGPALERLARAYEADAEVRLGRSHGGVRPSAPAASGMASGSGKRFSGFDLLDFLEREPLAGAQASTSNRRNRRHSEGAVGSVLNLCW